MQPIFFWWCSSVWFKKQRNSSVSISLDPSSTLSSEARSGLKCFKHYLINSVGEQPVLCRFGPESVSSRFFLCIPNDISFLCWCLWCRLLRGTSLLETTGSSANDLFPGWGYCFHVLHNSCIFLASYQLNMMFFHSTMDHLFFWRNWEDVRCDWGTEQITI